MGPIISGVDVSTTVCDGRGMIGGVSGFSDDVIEGVVHNIEVVDGLAMDVHCSLNDCNKHIIMM